VAQEVLNLQFGERPRGRSAATTPRRPAPPCIRDCVFNTGLRQSTDQIAQLKSNLQTARFSKMTIRRALTGGGSGVVSSAGMPGDEYNRHVFFS
jgi:hypothetical protein